MEKYYLNKNAQENGDHEVHKIGCRQMPYEENRIFLGEFYSCQNAVNDAKKYYVRVNGCYFCLRECHSS